MLSLPAHARVSLCTTAVDLRKSFDGLCGLVESVFQGNVLDGHLFLFLNKRRDRIKALWWDRDGLVIWYKNHESDYPHFGPFTEFAGACHNLVGRPAAAGGMD